MKSRQISLFAGALLTGTVLAQVVHSELCFAQPAKAGAVAAKPKGAAKGAAAEPQVALSPDVTAKLKSTDEAQIRGALDDVRTIGKGAQGAVPLLVDLLKRGLTAPLAEATLDTLGDVEGESASETIAWYTHHRAPNVRRAAVKALGHTKGAVAVKALKHALSDGDAGVRGSAASALGALKARESVGDLLTALDHRVVEAAAAIGQLCKEDECDKLASKLGSLQFDIVTSGLEQMLFRPPSEISDDAKVKVLGRIRELGTPDANKFLRDVQKRGTAFSPRVKQAIDQGILATGGAK